MTEKKPHDAFVGLGSNLGDRIATLDRALEMLDALPCTRLAKTSSYWATEPVGGAAQGEFINMAAHLRTALEPDRLMKELEKIERALGRTRRVKWGDRTCDLDLLFFDNRVITDPACLLPHPRLAERKFVLAPLAEIASDRTVPGINRKVAKLLQECADPHGIRKISPTRKNNADRN